MDEVTVQWHNDCVPGCMGIKHAEIKFDGDRMICRIDQGQFQIFVMDRMNPLTKDPWAGIASVKQSISAVVRKKIGFATGGIVPNEDQHL